MIGRHRKLSLLAGLSLALSLIGSPFAIAGGNGAQTTTAPVFFVGGNGCNGESILITGLIRFVYQTIVGPDGTVHASGLADFHATGQGSFGNEYRLNETRSFYINCNGLGKPCESTSIFYSFLISLGPAPNQLTKFQIGRASCRERV